MSIAEIERFAADLKSNEALRTEAEKAQPDKSFDAGLSHSPMAFESKQLGDNAMLAA